MANYLDETVRALRQSVREITNESEPIEDRMVEVGNAIDEIATAFDALNEKLRGLGR